MNLFHMLTNGSKFNAKNKKDLMAFTNSSSSNESLKNGSVLDFFGSDSEEPKLPPINDVEDAKSYRSQFKIKIKGEDSESIFPLRDFTGLNDTISSNLLAGGYSQPTPIQSQSIPVINSNRDLIAQAPTGSGKTIAFLVGLLLRMMAEPSIQKGSNNSSIKALIITPTRELAHQINRELKKLVKNKEFKFGVLSKSNNESKHDILITTPLRLVGALERGEIVLERHLVVDEADLLMELGFIEQIDTILVHCTNTTIRKYLFSATIPSGVETLANTIMTSPIRIQVGQKNSSPEQIQQSLVYVGEESGKLIAIRQQIQQGIKPPVLIFVQSIERAKDLFSELVYDGINVDVIHGERTQSQRDSIVMNFRSGKIWVLISTELMSRGVDFKGVSLVINYDFPQTSASYIHRIGRTGRNHNEGKAVTFFTKDDTVYLKSVVNVMMESGSFVEEWMQKMARPGKNDKKNLKRMPIRRDDISTVSKYDINKAEKKTQMVEGSKRRKLAISN